MKRHIPLLLLFLTISLKTALAQSTDVNTIQPKIMVIPYVKEGEDLRTVLEADFNKREVIAKIKNGFDQRGFTTKDFVATLKEAKDAKIFNTNTQSDVRSALVEFSGADIYVEVEYSIVKTEHGAIAKVILNGHDAATGNGYANITCDSRERYGADNGTLVNVAVSTPSPTVGDDPSKRNQVPCLEDFLNILQAKFTDMVNKGRPVKVDFSVASDAARNFDSKVKTVGDKQLSDVIDEWLAENSYKNNYHMQGTSPVRLFYDEVRIPVMDKNGHNFTLNKFGQNLTNYLSSKGITAKRSIKNGGIFITISN
jgi:hypothetical protein